MAEYDYDFFVIGGGSGGVRAARFAAGFGARVGIAEERHWGGTCVNIGCVPKKLMVYASHFAEDFEDAAGYGWSVPEASFDWPALIASKDKEIGRLNGIYKSLLGNAGVEVIDGRAVLEDAHTIRINGDTVTAKYVLIATGGQPSRSDEPGQELGIVSDDVFYLDRLPDRILIVGGGYIAVEFAGIFAGLGAETSLIYRRDLFMRGFDMDVRRFLAEEMPKKGVNLIFGQTVERIERGDTGLSVRLSDGSTHEYDQVLYAIGRQPLSAGMGLAEAGVALDANGAVKVDEHYRTSADNIFAIGDVTDRLQLTPVALAEGMAVARTLFNDQPSTVDYADIPTAVFSQPPIATVGLTEAAAREQYGPVDVYRSTFTPMKHTLSGRDEKTLMKLIVARDTQRVVGAHMCGMDAGEIIQGIGIAVKAGATKDVFDATIGIHPTAAEEFVTMREKLAEPVAEAAE